MALIHEVQNESQRGLILSILVDWKLEWMPFSELRVQILRRSGYALTDKELQFHLNYLAARDYIESRRLRAGRADLELTTVRATAKGLDLREGRIEPDPGVAL